MEGLKNVEQGIECYHCGESCEEELISFNEKAFCCNGCRLVYELLDENDLCNYYELENSPGISLKNRDYQEKFAFLENKEIQEKLLNYSSEELSKIVFKIPSIHCSSCIWLLEHLETLRDGIISSRVNFVKKEVSIDFNSKIIQLKGVVELLSTLGYEPEINLQNATETKTKKENRRLFLQIGIAGFGFGNIMMLSFPEYLGFEGLNINIQRFMSYAIILLSLPIVFFSASTYFTSAFKGLRQRYVNIDVPIAIGITTLFLRSLYDIITYSGSGYLDSLAGLVFFLLIGKWFQSKTYNSLSFERDYKSYFPLATHKIVGDQKVVAQVMELIKGDLIEVKNKEVIPADAILMSEFASIDYSFVTGEAEAISKVKGDRIYAGGRQVGSPIRLNIVKEVSQSYLTQLWNSSAFKETSKYEALIDNISKYFTLGVLLIASATAVFWYWEDPAQILNSVTAVLIVACPCALALATPFTLGNAMTILGRHKFYLRNTHIIEQLWKISLIIFDKTGTLTKGSAGNVHFHGRMTQFEKNLVSAAVSGSLHPLSKMIGVETASSKNFTPSTFEEVEGQGIKSVVEGHTVLVGSASWAGVTNPAEGEQMITHAYLSINGKETGYYTFGNVYRHRINKLIGDLNQYKLAVLSGDNESEFQNIKDLLPEGSEITFGKKPEDKLSFVMQKQELGEEVIMVGDGLNDAGALKQASVGIAVTEDVSAFTPASDAILFGGNLQHLGTYLKFARMTKGVIIASFTISFLYNVIGLSFAVSANMTPLFAAVLMPLSSITVVAFATFAVRGIALKLKL